MSQVDYLIVGQGIAGSFLSWYLAKAGKSAMVIDNNEPFSASRVAAGIINPVTGRRVVQTWMINQLLPFALEAYTSIGMDLGKGVITEKTMIDFFPTPQMLLAYRERISEAADFVSMGEDNTRFENDFHYDFGYGKIHPCYLIDLPSLLSLYRAKLRKDGLLLEEDFREDDLKDTGTGVNYLGIEAEKVIFCDGIGAARNKWFSSLPFAWNKGEALLVKCNDLDPGYLYKKGMIMAPTAAGYFWVGSSYEWNFEDPHPSAKFRDQTLAYLRQWVKKDCILEAHLASVRPATVERRPFVGLHPANKRVGMLNGMGTKGCSLAPYFASQLAGHLTENTPILPEANLQRYSRLLNRSR